MSGLSTLSCEGRFEYLIGVSLEMVIVCAADYDRQLRSATDKLRRLRENALFDELESILATPSRVSGSVAREDHRSIALDCRRF